MRLVKCVTSTRNPRATVFGISLQQSSTWFSTGRTSTRIDQTRWAHHLIDTTPPTRLHFKRPRRRGDIDGLRPHGVEFFELEGRLSTQDGSRKPNSDKDRLYAKVPLEHAADLRHRHV